jgi:23S rRNA (guanine745-N1)-methyltransferase
VAITEIIPRDSTTLATWLRCPRCERDLVGAGSAPWSILCSSGHTYDANRRGYLNLVDRSRGITGDTAQILTERATFLASGHYSPVADLLDGLVSTAEAGRVLDSGCGTGYYLEALLAARPSWDALALDVSVDAVAATVRATGAVGVVADVWRPLPVRSDRADVVLCVFAPRNASEFARVLVPGGRLVVVTPTSAHLQELRASGRVIGIQEDKLGHLDATLGASFELVERRSLEYTVDLTGREARSLAGMGPSGHHAAAGDPDRSPASSEEDRARTRVTVAVDASVYTPRV